LVKGKGIKMIQKCLQEVCEKPRAEPFEYCLDHFGEAAANYYIAAMKAGVKLPAWNNYDTGDGNWLPGYEEHEKPSNKGKSRKKG
jgi:hypothetical protein